MALSNNAVTIVLQALKSITSHPNQCFTAYDVTKAARNLTDENIRHEEVRDLIHAFYDQGLLKQYKRFPHSFWQNGRKVDAQIFCPPFGNPYAYDPDQVQVLDHDDEGPLDQDLDFDDFDDSPNLQQTQPQSQPALIGATPDTGNTHMGNDLPKITSKPVSLQQVQDPLTLIKEKIKGKLSKLSNMFWGI